MILTNKQKKAAYQFTINELNRGYKSVCGRLQTWLNINLQLHFNTCAEVLNCFPEFLVLKPKDTYIDGFWWPSIDKKIRIKHLESIISNL
jgi:hypothetical protein